VRIGRLAWLGEFSRYQWTVFLVAWLGWALDATDFGLFSIVLRPALTELLGGQPTVAEIGKVGGYLSMIGLLGWALGGFLFGIIADYIGRVRTLAISIVVFSVFTACQGSAETPVQLGIFRFLGGLGTGAEIVVGIPLVAEAFAENHSAKVLGIMMTGGAFGSIIGGLRRPPTRLPAGFRERTPQDHDLGFGDGLDRELRRIARRYRGRRPDALATSASGRIQASRSNRRPVRCGAAGECNRRLRRSPAETGRPLRHVLDHVASIGERSIL
jgi:hypothetical protein